MHNEELYALVISPNITRVIKSRTAGWAGNVERIDERCIKDLVETCDGNRQLGRLKHRKKDNIKMDLQEVGWGGIDWIGLAREREFLD